MEKLKNYHIQRSLSMWCYRQQHISLQEVKWVLIFRLMHNLLNLMVICNVYLANENVNKKRVTFVHPTLYPTNLIAPLAKAIQMEKKEKYSPLTLMSQWRCSYQSTGSWNRHSWFEQNTPPSLLLCQTVTPSPHSRYWWCSLVWWCWEELTLTRPTVALCGQLWETDLEGFLTTKEWNVIGKIAVIAYVRFLHSWRNIINKAQYV